MIKTVNITTDVPKPNHTRASVIQTIKGLLWNISIILLIPLYKNLLLTSPSRNPKESESKNPAILLDKLIDRCFIKFRFRISLIASKNTVCG